VAAANSREREIATKSYYSKLCLNCSGMISDSRLRALGICENCLERLPATSRGAFSELEKRGRLREYKFYYDARREFERFFDFFRSLLKSRPWSLQKVWAKRVLLGRSFSLVAPTGVGKTTLGMVIALYLSTKNKKSYILVPSAMLVQQVYERMAALARKMRTEPRILHYHSGLGERERRDVLEKLSLGDFDVFISTEMFLVKNFATLRRCKFDFVFVDDIDSFLKSPKNVDKILYCLGFDEGIIKTGLKLIDLILESSSEAPRSTLERISEMRREIELFKNRNRVGILVVSGATQKQKQTKRVKLFREMLGFDLGFRPRYLRRVKDFYLAQDSGMEEKVLNIVKTFGSGCLVFVPFVCGRKRAKELASFLNEHGIKAYVYEKMEQNILNDFSQGKYDCLVGIASTHSPLARGIDLPERIRYVVFAGVPRFEIELRHDEFLPSALLTLSRAIRNFLDERERRELDELAAKLRKLPPLTKERAERLRRALEQNEKLSGAERRVQQTVMEAQRFLKRVITEELVKRIEADEKISLREREGKLYLILSDAKAYIQATGRCSRLFAGGISRGASFLIIDDKKAFNDLKEKLRYYLEDAEFVRYREREAKRWFEKIDEDRKLLRDVLSGRVSGRIRDYIKVAVLIVESPTKAKTIARFFGTPSKREVEGVTIYEVSTGKYVLDVVASMGHLYDLVFSAGLHGVLERERRFYPVYDFIKRCSSCNHQFTEYDACPNCGSTEIFSKEAIVRALRKIAMEANEIFIGTDADAEGEKIAYDIFCTLYPVNRNIKRLEFHEITRKAILQAISNRREIDYNLVDAQIVRRVEDRWIGFELSQILWRVFGNRKLSAGRVQTPVLGWIIERCRDYRKKINLLEFYLRGEKFSVRNFRSRYAKGLKVRVRIEREFEREVPPPAPFTTDSLLKEASKVLKFSVEKTMRLAQELFELGLITYHRTDSTSVSGTGMGIAKEWLANKGMENLFKPRAWKKEGAHECIRPTKPLDVSELRALVFSGILALPRQLTWDHFALYNLIFKRFVASQMKEARARYQKVRIEIGSETLEEERMVEISYKGFCEILPLRAKKPLEEGVFIPERIYVRKVPKEYPYSQGDVVALMKERRIGRPSTYAKIVETLLKRRYVTERNGKLFSTPLGFKVYSFLSRHYSDYVSEDVTRTLEIVMDRIERGEEDYMKVLGNLYKEIEKLRRPFARRGNRGVSENSGLN